MYVCMYVCDRLKPFGCFFFCFPFFLFCLQLFNQPGLAPHHHPLFQVSLISFFLTFFFFLTPERSNTQKGQQHIFFPHLTHLLQMTPTRQQPPWTTPTVVAEPPLTRMAPEPTTTPLPLLEAIPSSPGHVTCEQGRCE